MKLTIAYWIGCFGYILTGWDVYTDRLNNVVLHVSCENKCHGKDETHEFYF